MVANRATMPTPGNPASDYPLTLAVAYRRWHGWRDAVYGRLHPSRRKRLLANARRGLKFAGKMVYDDKDARRSELFHRKPGRFAGAHADCSQYVSSCAHWSGVRSVTDTDWTGTLATKGKPVEQPVPGCIVLFGDPPYVHTGVMDEGRRVIGFGTPDGPDVSNLATLIAYFAGTGHPGHAFRDLTR